MTGVARSRPGSGRGRWIHGREACRSGGIGLALGASLLVLLGSPVRAGYVEGMDAFARGDYEIAYRELRPLAQKGDAGAQFTLGFMYDFGQGVPQNTQEAIWWYRHAAEQDIAVAHFSLGEIFERGRGTPRDLVAAYRWYSLAVEGLPPGEIRNSVIERRDAVLAQLDAKQIALARELLGRESNGADEKIAAMPSATQPEKVEADDSELIVAVQEALERFGYRPRWQPGVLDLETRDAIRAFEVETGRAVTGVASEDLLRALRAAIAPEEQTGPAPADRATTAQAQERERGPTQPMASTSDIGSTAAEPLAVAIGPDKEPDANTVLERPTGPAGGPLILDEDETAAPDVQLAVLPDERSGEGRPQAGSDSLAERWDLQFIDRQIARLDEIMAGVDGPSAAVPGWDELETWERETRGLLAARLGQERADSLSEQRQEPVLGDPLGNLRRTASAFRDYLNGLLETAR